MRFTTTGFCRLSICAAALMQGAAIGGVINMLKDALSSEDEAGFGGGMWLRIMPLGASITYGVKSTDGNGYRKVLRDKIVAYGNDVNMVGSRRNGTMEDNDVEGWPGYIIDQVHTVVKTSLPKYKPNLVLVNVGTNDCSGNVDIPNAGKRLSSMLDDVYAGSARATVVLSTLLVRADAAKQKCVLDVNAQYRAVAAAQRSNGRRIVLADMQPPAGPTTAELVDDGTHPTDAGYAKMAAVWLQGLRDADDAGFLLTKEAIPGNADGVPDRGVYG
ncbi:putative GDSL-like lipase acylhydrolase [Rosellinia necatrix]|uniref:Putative GDSL-like lipase acylhydrolase n=1 Tax=Rosellinia necatrix TaxID=77044 RepID=A0A1W2TD35_ROSNE|nr:putative GDSL-like lipase acylhydrolase [Rosellinia necatrix]